MDGLTQGRIVHYIDDVKGGHHAAIVTDVMAHDGTIGLHIFPSPAVQCFVPRDTIAEFDPDGKKHGSWHWIERA